MKFKSKLAFVLLPICSLISISSIALSSICIYKNNSNHTVTAPLTPTNLQTAMETAIGSTDLYIGSFDENMTSDFVVTANDIYNRIRKLCPDIQITEFDVSNIKQTKDDSTNHKGYADLTAKSDTLIYTGACTVNFTSDAKRDVSDDIKVTAYVENGGLYPGGYFDWDALSTTTGQNSYNLKFLRWVQSWTDGTTGGLNNASFQPGQAMVSPIQRIWSTPARNICTCYVRIMFLPKSLIYKPSSGVEVTFIAYSKIVDIHDYIPEEIDDIIYDQDITAYSVWEKVCDYYNKKIKPVGDVDLQYFFPDGSLDLTLDSANQVLDIVPASGHSEFSGSVKVKYHFIPRTILSELFTTTYLGLIVIPTVNDIFKHLKEENPQVSDEIYDKFKDEVTNGTYQITIDDANLNAIISVADGKWSTEFEGNLKVTFNIDERHGIDEYVKNSTLSPIDCSTLEGLPPTIDMLKTAIDTENACTLDWTQVDFKIQYSVDGLGGTITLNGIEGSLVYYRRDIPISVNFTYTTGIYVPIYGLTYDVLTYNDKFTNTTMEFARVIGHINNLAQPYTTLKLPLYVDLNGINEPNSKHLSIEYIGKDAFKDYFVNSKAVRTIDLSQIFSESIYDIIGESAFEGCDGITTVSLPPKLSRIDDKAFNGCTNLATFSNLTSINKNVNSWLGEFRQSYFDGINVGASAINQQGVQYIGQKVFNGTAWYDNTAEDQTIVQSGTRAVGPKFKTIAFGTGSSERKFTIDKTADATGNWYLLTDACFGLCAHLLENDTFLTQTYGNSNTSYTANTVLHVFGDYALKGCTNLSVCWLSGVSSQYLVVNYYGAHCFEDCNNVGVILPGTAPASCQMNTYGQRPIYYGDYCFHNVGKDNSNTAGNTLNKCNSIYFNGYNVSSPYNSNTTCVGSHAFDNFGPTISSTSLSTIDCLTWYLPAYNQSTLLPPIRIKADSFENSNIACLLQRNQTATTASNGLNFSSNSTYDINYTIYALKCMKADPIWSNLKYHRSRDTSTLLDFGALVQSTTW